MNAWNVQSLFRILPADQFTHCSSQYELDLMELMQSNEKAAGEQDTLLSLEKVICNAITVSLRTGDSYSPSMRTSAKKITLQYFGIPLSTYLIELIQLIGI